MNWTDDRVKLLKKLWGDGLSASQIAMELGGISRNSVIGKVHRLGLSGRGKTPANSTLRKPSKPRRRNTFAMPVVHQARPPALPVVTLVPEPEPEVIESIIPIGQRCTLFELNDDTCRWPVGVPGEDDFFFCGGRPVEGLPYCRYHSRLAYQPSEDPKRGKAIAEWLSKRYGGG